MLRTSFLRFLPAIALGVFLVWAAGCSQGSPATPEVGSTPEASAHGVSNSSGHQLWGEWLITMHEAVDDQGNLVDVEFEITPHRSSEAHYNITGMLTPPKCTDCIKIVPYNVEPDPPWVKITAWIELTNKTGLTGYEVRGVIYPPSDMVTLENRDGWMNLYSSDMEDDFYPFKTFGTDVQFHPFPGHTTLGTDFVFKKHIDYKLYDMPYRVTACWPDVADEPVSSYIPSVAPPIHPNGSNTWIYVFLTDWQNDIQSVKLDLSAFGVPDPVDMTEYSEPEPYVSGWQYHLTQAAGGGEDWRTLWVIAQSTGDLIYKADFKVKVEWDKYPPIWKEPGLEGIYDHISGPGDFWLFYHEAWDVSLPILYIFYGNDQSSPFDGEVLKVDSSDTYIGYTAFSGFYNEERYFGVRLQDGQGIQDGNMLEYVCTHYSADPKWSFWKDQPGPAQGITGSVAIGDVNGDGKDDIVVGSKDKFIYVYDGSGTGTQDTIIWEYETGQEVNGTPALADLDGDSCLDVIVASNDCSVYAINGATGLPLWIAPLNQGQMLQGAPAIAQLNDPASAYDVIIGTGEQGLVALDGEDGSVMWTYPCGGIAGTPGLADVTGDGIWDACVGAYDTYVHMVNGATGEAVWSPYYIGPGMYNVDCSPTMVDVNNDSVPDCIIGAIAAVGDPKTRGAIFAINGQTGEDVWAPQGEIYGNPRHSPAPVKINDDPYWDFIVTCWTEDVYSFYGLDGVNGSIIYATLAPDLSAGSQMSYGAPIVGDFTGDGHINALVPREDGCIDLYNLATFELPGQWAGRHMYKLHTATSNNPWISGTPAVADVNDDGRLDLIACDMRGYTYILDLNLSVPAEGFAWNQHHGNRWHTGVPGFVPPDE